MIYNTAQVCGDEPVSVYRINGGDAVFVSFGEDRRVTMERRHIVAAMSALIAFKAEEEAARALQAAE